MGKALDLLLPPQRRSLGQGVITHDGYRKIAVAFPGEVFEEIRRMAARQHCSISQMAAELCRVGLLDLSESDALEITPQEEATPLAP